MNVHGEALALFLFSKEGMEEKKRAKRGIRGS